MAANVLNSSRAVQMSIFIVRAFLRMREELASGADILKRLAAIDRKLLVHDAVCATSTENCSPSSRRRRIGPSARSVSM